MAKDFIKPEVERVKTSPKLDSKVDQPMEPIEIKPAPLNEVPKYPDEEPKCVAVADMFNYSKDAVSAVFMKSIEDYAEVLIGRKACMNPRKEQAAFMNTIYGTLTLDFDKFCVVTDYLVNYMVNNPESFSDMNLFSLMSYVEKDFSKAQRSRYRSYMMALATLARAGRNRRNISRFIDIPTLVSEFSDKAKNNVNSYFVRAYRA